MVATHALALAIGAVAVATLGIAVAQSGDAPPPKRPNATEVTVYNQGFALVKQTRRIPVPAGEGRVAIEDVAARIDPTSVSFVPRTGALRVLEQNYRYDLVGKDAILAKSVGGRVRFTRTMGNEKDVLEGTLISSPTAIVNNGDGAQTTYNGVVIKLDNGRLVLDPTGEIEVLSLPEGLISKPTLEWTVQGDTAGEALVDLAYITQGASWSADYVLTLSPASRADLQGWVTLNNQSGATFTDATLKLLAGDVNVERRRPAREAMMDMAATPMSKAAGGFQEESLFEYHLYTLDRPATIRDKETKQLSLLQGAGVPYKTKLVVDSMMGFGNYYPSEGRVGEGEIKPLATVEFTNDKKSNLGMPLPKGRFRIYQRDASGSTQLLGESSIEHTPRDEKIVLNVGRSFDVVANRKRTNYERMGDRGARETFEIEVRNRKSEPTEVTLIERKWGEWKIVKTSQDWTKADANAAVYTVKLAAGEVKKVTYTVETRW